MVYTTTLINNVPFKSENQRRYFYAANRRGDITNATLKKWEGHTPKDKQLPESVAKQAYEIGVKFATDEIYKTNKIKRN